MSELADKTAELLDKAFPLLRCKREHYVFFMGKKLFFDFYIPDLKVCIEVQGQQHYQFVPFFHQVADSFRKQKYRDQLKTEWCAENNIIFIEVSGKSKHLTQDNLRNTILKAVRENSNGSAS